jgi:hyperosmotically inducible protein
MSFRLGALLCLSGLAACSHNTSQTAKDPTYVAEPTAANDPSMTPASLEGTKATTPAPDHGSADVRAPVVADMKGTSPNSARPSEPPPAAEPPKPAEAVDPSVAPDNTKVNKRDANSAALTPMDQKENQTDLKITQQIRQAVMADSSLSFTAKNVKIITQNGKVTLRGPVKTEQERGAIEAAARKVAGATQVDNQLEVKK